MGNGKEVSGGLLDRGAAGAEGQTTREAASPADGLAPDDKTWLGVLEDVKREHGGVDLELPERVKGVKPTVKKGFPKWAVALVAVVVVALVAVGAAFALQPAPEQGQVQDEHVEVVGQEEPEPGTLSVTLKADGWERGKSTPAVLKATGAEGVSYPVIADLMQSVDFPEDDAVQQIEAIGPVNADGSFFKGTLQVAEPAGDAEWALELVPAEKVTQADADAIMAALGEALASGQIAPADAEGLADAFSANLKAAPGVDAEKVEEQAQAAEQAAAAAQEAGSAQSSTASGTQASSTNSGEQGSSSSTSTTSTAQQSAPAHVHNWVDHHASRTVTTYVDEVHPFCSLCGDINGEDVNAHFDKHDDDDRNASYYSALTRVPKTTTEDFVDYQYCTGCGATR